MRHQGSSQIRRWAVRGTVAVVAASAGIHAAENLLGGEGGNTMSTGDLAVGGSTSTDTDPLDLIHKVTGLTPVELVGLLVVLLVVLVGSSVLLPRYTRAPGFATNTDLRRNMSERTARLSAAKTRPSLTKRELRKAHWGEYGIRMGRSNRNRFRTVFGTFEETILITGPTGSYKSVFLAGTVMDAPGAVAMTTTKVEDVEATIRVRAMYDRPVYVFNPYELGDELTENSFHWSPVLGCQDERTAMSRAAYMLYGARSGSSAGGELNNFFQSTACEVLRAYLMAADLAGLDMRDVYRWTTDADDDEALKILRKYGARGDWIEVLEQRQSTTDRTRDGIFTTLSTALSWMADPVIAAAVCPEEPHESFNVAQFIRNRGALYLLAEHRLQSSVAPLFTMIMGHLVEEAKLFASKTEGRRLDPSLFLILDEAANICPVPLTNYYSENRGHGIVTIAAIQSRSQLAEMWGTNGAKTIWNNAAWTLILAGIKDGDDLEAVSKMLGTYERPKTNRQHGPNGVTVTHTTEDRPVMPPARVRQLPKRQILAIHRGSPPVLVTVSKSWKRKDVRAAGKAAAAANKRLKKAAASNA
ncbi:MAG: hypothetical protein AUG49_19005 [Catenulispora sp. 13_1_20CM_3_70_7]|nr:MAG: hypothetical protein AUG49_19005 [Catenulispora sp. 13_1_20CM_3_70_7]